jgi:hypothetical protein
MPKARPVATPALPEAWVVRIYRRDPGALVGEVERVGADTRVRFHGLDELSAVLARAPRRTKTRRPA